MQISSLFLLHFSLMKRFKWFRLLSFILHLLWLCCLRLVLPSWGSCWDHHTFFLYVSISFPLLRLLFRPWKGHLGVAVAILCHYTVLFPWLTLLQLTFVNLSHHPWSFSARDYSPSVLSSIWARQKKDQSHCQWIIVSSSLCRSLLEIVCLFFFFLFLCFSRCFTPEKLRFRGTQYLLFVCLVVLCFFSLASPRIICVLRSLTRRSAYSYPLPPTICGGLPCQFVWLFHRRRGPSQSE